MIKEIIVCAGCTKRAGYTGKCSYECCPWHAIHLALKFLDGALPGKRNGPCYQAINVLRYSLNLSPMEPGGNALDGFEQKDKP